MFKFQFVISRQANLYFFVQNLAEWHSRNKKQTNSYWIKQTHPLTPREKIALHSFKEVRLRYPSTKSIFDQAFFSEKDPFRKLSSLPEDDLETTKNVLDLFSNRFQCIYKSQSPRLEQWQTRLSSLMNHHSQSLPIIQTLQRLYRTRPSNKKIKIYLLISSPIEWGGGANIDDRSLTKE